MVQLSNANKVCRRTQMHLRCSLLLLLSLAALSRAEENLAANETTAAALCKAFAEAEEIYHRTDYDADGVLEYCSKMTGATSLATNNGTEIALIDRAFAGAETSAGTPKAGYIFTVLTTQTIPMARNFVSNSNMTLGYAFSAAPGAYDSTGRDSFMISNAGTIYQSDQGSAVILQSTFNPVAPTWTPTE